MKVNWKRIISLVLAACLLLGLLPAQAMAYYLSLIHISRRGRGRLVTKCVLCI